MKQYLLAGLLAVATPPLAHAKPSLPVIGWSVSPGHSTTGSKICTLFGGFGQHSDLAWVADAASPPQHFTLLFDDGGAPPQSKLLVSQLTVATPGSPPLSISGTTRFGQFKTSLDGRTLEPFLRMFVGKRSMTVALDGETPVPVSLKGSAGAAQDMLRCEEVQNIVQLRTTPVRIAAARPHPTAPAPRGEPAISAPPMDAAPPLPDPAPAAKAVPAPVVAIAVPASPMDPAPPLPDPAPAAPAVRLPALAVATAVPMPLVAMASPLPQAKPAAPPVPAPDPDVASAAPKPPVDAATPSPAQTPAPAAQLAFDDTRLLAKAIEDQFLAILQEGKASFENTSDKALSLGARANRATDLCTLLGNDKEVIAWTGTLSELSPNGQGGGVVAVKLADGTTVGTMNNQSSDSMDPSAIAPASDVLQAVSRMHIGERVTFSGHFFANNADCIKETSPTQAGSMTAPKFLMKFTAVEPQQ